MRNCYRCLLWMHPAVFRREYGNEMLWIFDQTAGSQGAIALFELFPQLRHFCVQVPMSIFKPVGRADECAERIRQLTFHDLWHFHRSTHWNSVRSRQHLPS